MDDLEHVAVGNRDMGKGGARNDLAIALNRDLGGIEPKRTDEVGNAAGGLPPWLAVYRDFKGVVRAHCR